MDGDDDDARLKCVRECVGLLSDLHLAGVHTLLTRASQELLSALETVHEHWVLRLPFKLIAFF